MLPLRAMQRGGCAAVPRMQAVTAVTGSVRPAGTTPPGNSSISPQWKETRQVAQQAPQRWQGFASAGTDGQNSA